MKLKRRLCYKNTVFNENVRPHKIIAALQYLLKTSQLYKENNININPEWLEHFTQQNKSTSLILNSNIQINNPKITLIVQMKKLQMKNNQMRQV